MAKINIKTKIRLGFIAVFLIMALTTIYLIFQINNIAKKTKIIYEHPLKVSNSIRDVKIEIYKTTLLVRDIKYLENNQRLDDLIKMVKREDSLINVDFKIIRALYLGNKTDVEDLIKSYNDLRPIRQKLYQLKRENNLDSLDYLLQNKNNAQIDTIIHFSDMIAAFANMKADNTFNEVIKTEKKSLYISILFLLITSLVVFIFSIYLSKRITEPLKKYIDDVTLVISGQSKDAEPKVQHEEEIFDLTLEELKKSYTNIEQQNEEIRSFNEQLARLNTSLEEKVRQRTNELKKSIRNC